MRSLLIFVAMSTCDRRTEAADAQQHRATLADLGVQVGLTSPVISPDGKQIAVVASRANYADNRFEHELVLVDSVTGAQQRLASAHSNIASPQWSPTGDRLAWLESAEAGEPQIYIISSREAGARPVSLTDVVNGVRNNWRGSSSFEWSPDGKFIAFITEDSAEVPQGDERHNKSFEVVDNDYLATTAPPSFHVWIVSANGGQPRRLTSGTESVTGLAWQQKGKSIVVAGQPRPHNSDLDYAEFMQLSSGATVLETVDIASGTPHVMVPAARILSAPIASPHGDLIAYQRFRGPDPWSYPHDIAVVPASGGDARNVAASLDRDIGEFAWLPDDNTLLAAAPDGTRIALWTIPVDGSIKRLDLGSVADLNGLTVSTTGAIAFVGSEPRQPPELYLMTSGDTKPRRLTHFNDPVAALDLGRSETIRWSLDGFEQTGVLTYPPDFNPGVKYPLVLNIHGGPQSAATEGFGLFDQILAARGWIVFRPNYRGSDTQGSAYQSAVIDDLGDGPGRDVMAGIAAIRARGVIDDNRIAVSGWSYGGYMTAWLIGHYPGWSSAVAGAPLTNLLDWYSSSCCNAWANPAVSGSPWVKNNFANYWRQSPISYADQVKTPTLILQNMGDPEVPYTGSYSFYHALRDNGVPVKFVVYPVQGHSYNGDPIHQRDTLRRWIGWIDEHFHAQAAGQH
jgi:dipeptidyl aminopeptidase/acylaminoacyl peptidase